LFDLFGLTASQAQDVISTALEGTPQHTYCDIYFQKASAQELYFDKGQLKRPTISNVRGAGVQVKLGDQVGYSSRDTVDIDTLKSAANDARTIFNYSNDTTASALAAIAAQPHNLYDIAVSPVFDVSFMTKLKLLRDIDAHARAYDKRITNVEIMLAVSDEEIILVNSDGKLLHDSRPLVRMKIYCYATEGKRIEKCSEGGGGRVELDVFLKGDKWKTMTETAAQRAIDMLKAVDAPAGEMDVVLGNGWSGVMIHEAVGHGLEGDFNRKGISAFSGKMGEMVASKVCTVVDDGTMKGLRGSLNFDDEGTPTGKTTLIEGGKLIGYMQDRQNASLMNVKPTGNGRRQGYQHVPIPRMTNTYLVSAEKNPPSPEEMIKSVKKGLYVSVFGGGRVDITSGEYVFAAEQAYLIEDGKLGPLVRGAQIIGNGPKSMQKIAAIGNDLELDPGVGTCGKEGQGVPVNVGTAHVHMKEVTVGGKEGA
jgi:TldD protein